MAGRVVLPRLPGSPRGAHSPRRSPACRGVHGSRSPAPGVLYGCMAPVAGCVCKAVTAHGRGVCCSRCAAMLPAHSRAGAYGVVLIRAHALPAWHSFPGVSPCGRVAPRRAPVSLTPRRSLMRGRVAWHSPARVLPPGVLHDMACAVWLPALPWCLCVSAHGCNGSRRGGRGSCSPGVCLLTPGAPRHGLTCAILCRCGLLGAYQAIPRLGRHSRRS